VIKRTWSLVSNWP